MQANGDDSQRQALLSSLSELGNAFALLCLLDDVLAAERMPAFLLAAPLFGMTNPSDFQAYSRVSLYPFCTASCRCSFASKNLQQNVVYLL